MQFAVCEKAPQKMNPEKKDIEEEVVMETETSFWVHLEEEVVMETKPAEEDVEVGKEETKQAEEDTKQAEEDQAVPNGKNVFTFRPNKSVVSCLMLATESDRSTYIVLKAGREWCRVETCMIDLLMYLIANPGEEPDFSFKCIKIGREWCRVFKLLIDTIIRGCKIQHKIIRIHRNMLNDLKCSFKSLKRTKTYREIEKEKVSGISDGKKGLASWAEHLANAKPFEVCRQTLCEVCRQACEAKALQEIKIGLDLRP